MAESQPKPLQIIGLMEISEAQQLEDQVEQFDKCKTVVVSKNDEDESSILRRSSRARKAPSKIELVEPAIQRRSIRNAAKRTTMSNEDRKVKDAKRKQQSRKRKQKNNGKYGFQKCENIKQKDYEMKVKLIGNIELKSIQKLKRKGLQERLVKKEIRDWSIMTTTEFPGLNGAKHHFAKNGIWDQMFQMGNGDIIRDTNGPDFASHTYVNI